MKKIVVSWVAWFYDFLPGQGGAVNLEGPTCDMHRHFYDDHDIHLLLSTGPQDDPRSLLLAQQLRQDFPEHTIDLRFLDVYDVFDFQELKLKSDRILEEFSTCDIDILFSNGTTPMRTAWVLLHLEGRFATHLIQGKSREIAQGSSRFPEIRLDKEIFPFRLEARVKEPTLPAEKFALFEGILPVYQKADKIAAVDFSDLTTLIRGASGTGKENLARYIHLNSARKNQPFVAVNCSALGNELLESRLFGHVKGAFTGASRDHAGYFEAAQGGTLFLDEIGDISPYMQQALLRALQEKEITRVGANQAVPVDVRIIAATNQPLEQLCETGVFRWDLYWRLNMTELELPALSDCSVPDRKGLIAHFLLTLAHKFRCEPLRLHPDLERFLLAHDFPGNIRELENVISNFYVFAEGEVMLSQLPRYFRRRHEKASLMLFEVEKSHIQKVMEICDGNKTHAARELGIAVNTLKEKLRKYEMEG